MDSNYRRTELYEFWCCFYYSWYCACGFLSVIYIYEDLSFKFSNRLAIKPFIVIDRMNIGIVRKNDCLYTLEASNLIVF